MSTNSKKSLYAALGKYEAEAYKHGLTGSNALAVDAAGDEVMAIFVAMIARNAELEADARRWQAMRMKFVGVDWEPEIGGGAVFMFECSGKSALAGPEGADAIADAAQEVA